MLVIRPRTNTFVNGRGHYEGDDDDDVDNDNGKDHWQQSATMWENRCVAGGEIFVAITENFP